MGSLEIFLREWVGRMNPDREVEGLRLQQIGRLGSDGWQKLFGNLAQRVKAEGPEACVHLVAYSAMWGIASLWKLIEGETW